MQWDALPDLQGHDPIHDQVAHLVGVVDISHSEEMEPGRVIRASGQLEDRRRLARGDDAFQFLDGLPRPLVQIIEADRAFPVHHGRFPCC
jgi:hypothetical protein